MRTALLLVLALFPGPYNMVCADPPDIQWWKIEGLLTNFANQGLGADQLQTNLTEKFLWKTSVMNGTEKLQELNNKATSFFGGIISNLDKLKNEIELHYHSWPLYTVHNISLEDRCCDTLINPSGCTLLASTLNDTDQVRAVRPPDTIIHLMKEPYSFDKNLTRYLSFEDGSLFVSPTTKKKDLKACEDYDPRKRYFYTQCKSPEPRDVVVVVHELTRQNPLLIQTIDKVFKSLSPIDRMSLCLPNKNDSCSDFEKGRRDSQKWPNGNIPLGNQHLLGRLIINNQRNSKKLTDALQNVTNKADGVNVFSSHTAALEAGVKLFHTEPLFKRKAHPVLVYVTTNWPDDWEHNALFRQLNATLNDTVSYIICPINENSTVERGVVEELGNLTFSPFRNEQELADHEIGIPSFGLGDTNRIIIPSPYFDAFGDLYIISVCKALMKDTTFLGCVCADLSITNWLEAELNVDNVEGGYVFIVNDFGQALKHPLLPSPHSLKEDPTYVSIDKLEIGGSADILKKVVEQETGKEDVVGVYVQSLGRPQGRDTPSAVWLPTRKLRYLWASVHQTGLTITIVLPTNEKGEVESSIYRCKSNDECVVNHFQYSQPNSVVTDEGLVKFAPDCFIDVLSYIREGIKVDLLFSVFSGTRPQDEVFREDIRASVKFVEMAEDIWKKEKNDNIGSRYMGTEDGVYISYPGKALNHSFDHRDRPWYQTAISTTELSPITMTSPYRDEMGKDIVCTVSKTLTDRLGKPKAVVAGDFSLNYIMKFFHKEIPYCRSNTCFLVDRLGFVVLKSGWSNSTTEPMLGTHITIEAPDIARSLIGMNYLNRRGCHDYEKELTYYYWILSFRGHRTWHGGDSYGIHMIASTNLFLVYRTRRSSAADCNCDPFEWKKVVTCKDTCDMECECPCVAGEKTVPCHDAEADLNRFDLPACKPQGLLFPSASN